MTHIHTQPVHDLAVLPPAEMQQVAGGMSTTLVVEERTTTAICHGTTVLAYARVDG